MKPVMILEGARTPFAAWAGGLRGNGEKGGALKGVEPFDLGAAALKGALAKAGVEGERLDHVVFSLMYAVGPHACYGARYVSLRAGIPARVPASSVSMACGSGLFAFISAAREVANGAGVVATGGSDNVSLVRRDVFIPSFKDISCGLPIAKTAETMAAEYKFSRQDQDRWALRSHRVALKARAAGLFAEEIVPVGGVEADDHILEDPSPERFAAQETLFEEQGATATRANTHGISDGASALILAAEGAAPSAAKPPLGRYLAGAVIGLPPERMAFASVLAARKAVEDAGLKISDIDLFEINETFASQILIGIKELGLSEEQVNVNGGALALGHAFAGTGCRQILTLLKELRRRGLKRGLASICVGSGLGVAAVVEA